MALRMKDSNGRARRETGQHARKVEVRKDSFGDGRPDKRKGFATNVCGLPGTALHGGSWQQAAGSKQGCETASALADECKIHLSRFQRWFLSNFKSPRYILTPAINILTWSCDMVQHRCMMLPAGCSGSFVFSCSAHVNCSQLANRASQLSATSMTLAYPHMRCLR